MNDSKGAEKTGKASWVLLRGWTREKRHWRDFPEILAQKTGGKVFVLDLPGAGTEFLRTSPIKIREITEDLRSRYRRDFSSQTDGAVIVLGISMGGMIALDWAEAFPADFSGIVLLNSSLASLSPPWERLNLKNVPKMLALAMKKNWKMRERGILELTSSLQKENLDLIASEFSQICVTAPVRKITLFRQLIAAMRFSPRALTSSPALVISSRCDRLVSSKCSEKLAAKLNADVIVHPWAGHDLPLDDPAWLASELAKWLISRHF